MFVETTFSEESGYDENYGLMELFRIVTHKADERRVILVGQSRVHSTGIVVSDHPSSAGFETLGLGLVGRSEALKFTSYCEKCDTYEYEIIKEAFIISDLIVLFPYSILFSSIS